MTDVDEAEQRLQDAANTEAARMQLNQSVAVLVAMLDTIADPMQAAVSATEVLEQIEDLKASTSVARKRYLTRAFQDGWSVTDMARSMGLSRARVDQLLNRRNVR